MVMSEKSPRLVALDYLRGFFIVVIIIDHLWRWPSVYELITGKGELWVTAAEGFVIISGLLIGYIRGFKNRDLPLIEVSKKLWKRAALLYAWLVGMSLVYTAMVWHIPTLGATAWIKIPKDSWNELLQSTIYMTSAHVWVHFLYIYALLLALTPIVIWMLRRGWWHMVIVFTFAGYAAGRLLELEFLQWMPMFFLPAIAGYYLTSIQSKWKKTSFKRRQVFSWGVMAVTALSVIASIVCVFVVPENTIAATLNHAFTKEFSFNVARIPMALLWFIAFVLLFEYGQRIIGKYLGWLLLPFGIRSLTAYIAHGLVLFVIALIFVDMPNIWYNTAIGTLAIIATWGFIQIPFIQKIIPR